MHENDRHSDRSEASNGTNDRRRAADRSSPVSRRRFLRASAAAGALALGGTGVAAGQSAVEQSCQGGDSLTVGDGDGIVVNNDWGTSDVDMCIYRYDDGSYGWDWSRGDVGGEPNYPEVIVGTKPWGTDTGVSLFPVQFGDVDEMDVELDVDTNPSGGNWNLALEWWHTTQRPGGDVGESITHEIMLVLEWGSEHSHGAPVESNAITDSYGNQIDYWQHYRPEDGWDWNFHIFRIAANEAPSEIDLASIVDYLDREVDDSTGFPSDLWITGIEIGNEYWANTSGETTFHRFDATVNGQTATTGSGGDGGGDSGSGGDGGSDGDSGSDDGGSDDGGSDDGSGSDPDGDYPVWDADEVYLEGDRVVWNGSVWEARWWTQGQEPRREDWYVWEHVGTADGDGGSDDGGSDGGADDGDSGSDDGGTDDGDSGSDDGSDDGSDGGDSGSGSDSDPASDDLIAQIDPSATSASVGEPITFRVEDTSGSGRWIDSLEWESGDGATAEGWWNQHAYDAPGEYTAALIATDNEGNRTTHEVTITVS